VVQRIFDQNGSLVPTYQPGLPDEFPIQKTLFGYILKGLGMENIGLLRAI
jgi:hypothetical protein